MLVTLTLLYIRLELDLKNTTSLDWIVIIISFASLFIANMLSNYLWLAITLITVTIFINIYSCRFRRNIISMNYNIRHYFSN